MKLIRYYNIEKNKETVLVTDEGDFAIWVRDYERDFSSLRAGDEIENAEELCRLAVRREIKKKAIKRLAAGDITKKELYRRLIREKIHGTTVDTEFLEELLAKLERAGYIDERGYANRFAQKCVEKKWGRAKIRGAMIDRGFESEMIDDVLSALDCDFVALARELIETSLDGVERDTARRRLYARGFSSEEIIKAYEQE